jgi:hypothetical protein
MIAALDPTVRKLAYCAISAASRLAGGWMWKQTNDVQTM